jgi:hypothetical protein
MALQDLDNQPSEAPKSAVGPLTEIPSLGASRKKRAQGSGAWHQTVTQHEPEPWLAARLALQARIAALDIEAQARIPASSQ